MFFKAYGNGTSARSCRMYSGSVSWISGRQSVRAADWSLHMTLPVMPPVLSCSVLGYTPVRAPCDMAPSCGTSTSGCTMLSRLPKACGLPKKRNVLPGTSRWKFQRIPLKKTISIWPEASSTITDRRLTAPQWIGWVSWDTTELFGP